MLEVSSLGPCRVERSAFRTQSSAFSVRVEGGFGLEGLQALELGLESCGQEDFQPGFCCIV